MASLHSGLVREEIELVKIVTEKFSLIIKGKPYHEKYEGIKQYQALNFHDEMNFSIDGIDLKKALVFHVNKNEMRPHVEDDFPPIFFENGIYTLLVTPKGEEEISFYHEHKSLRNAISRVEIEDRYFLMGNLYFPNEVGLSTLEIRQGNETLLKITIEIFPVKLDYKRDYKKLLEEVNDEVYNLAFHFLRRTYQMAGIKLGGNVSQVEFYRLITYHFESFFKSINRVEKQPHHQLIKTYKQVRGDQLKRLDSKGRSHLRKRPHVFIEVDKGIPINGKTVMPTKGIQEKKEVSYDTIENRYIKWMFVRLIEKLTYLKETILNQKTKFQVKADVEVLEKIQNMIENLEKKKNQPFWKTIGRLDRSVMSLVMQMAPGYREAFQIFLIVSKGLSLQSSIYQMSVKDVATLYEYWTYLKLGQILRNKYKMTTQNIVKVNRNGLFVTLDSKKSAMQRFIHPHTKEQFELVYQLKEKNLPTTLQQPDTVLKIEKKGRDYTFNYIFDAKYRIDFAVEGSSYFVRYKTPGPMEEDINTMHRYRDSIVSSESGSYERTAFGAYVLFPFDREEEYQNHPLYKSIDQVNIGGLPLLPNATELVERVIENIVEKNPEEIHKEGILPKGTISEWRSSLDEIVFVGVVSNQEQYHACMNDRKYQIILDKLHVGWQKAKYVALYLTKDVTKNNGVVCYGEILDIRVDGRKINFKVNGWTKLKTIINPVHYGIARYAFTTILTLKQATELPELFMKSKEEMMIWRMLRRVTDHIQIELNSFHLDDATKIKNYKFRGIQVNLLKGNGQVEIVNNDVRKLFYSDEFIKEPTRMFREILMCLEGKKNN